MGLLLSPYCLSPPPPPVGPPVFTPQNQPGVPEAAPWGSGVGWGLGKLCTPRGGRGQLPHRVPGAPGPRSQPPLCRPGPLTPGVVAPGSVPLRRHLLPHLPEPGPGAWRLHRPHFRLRQRGGGGHAHGGLRRDRAGPDPGEAGPGPGQREPPPLSGSFTPRGLGLHPQGPRPRSEGCGRP